VQQDAELQNKKFSFCLEQYISVFQAEVYAIEACVTKNLDRRYRNRNIYNLSDSQAAIRALGNH
jgi:hypothetical protein